LLLCRLRCKSDINLIKSVIEMRIWFKILTKIWNVLKVFGHCRGYPATCYAPGYFTGSQWYERTMILGSFLLGDKMWLNWKKTFIWAIFGNELIFYLDTKGFYCFSGMGLWRRRLPAPVQQSPKPRDVTAFCIYVVPIFVIFVFYILINKIFKRCLAPY
jgi:hypothetical protein